MKMEGKPLGGRRQWRKEEEKARRKTRASATFIELGPSGGFGANFAAKTSTLEWRRRQQKKLVLTGCKGQKRQSASQFNPVSPEIDGDGL